MTFRQSIDGELEPYIKLNLSSLYDITYAYTQGDGLVPLLFRVKAINHTWDLPVEFDIPGVQTIILRTLLCEEKRFYRKVIFHCQNICFNTISIPNSEGYLKRKPKCRSLAVERIRIPNISSMSSSLDGLKLVDSEDAESQIQLLRTWGANRENGATHQNLHCRFVCFCFKKNVCFLRI